MDIIKRTVEKFDGKTKITEEVFETSSVEELTKLRESILPDTGDWYGTQISCYIKDYLGQIYVARGQSWYPAFVAGDYALIPEQYGIELSDEGVFEG